MEFLISDKLAFLMLLTLLSINLLTSFHLFRDKSKSNLSAICFILFIWLIPVIGVLFYWIEYLVKRTFGRFEAE